MSRRQFCFVTEADLGMQGVGGVTTDLEALRALREFGDVDVIYLQRTKYRSTSLALIVFLLGILRSFSKSYSVYFSRGLVASLFLASLNILTLGRRKVAQRALSVPFGTQEIRYVDYNRLEYFLRYSLFLLLERFAYFRADVIVVAAEAYGEELIRTGIRRDQIHVISFAVDPIFFDQPLKTGFEGAFCFGYIGGFHTYQDIRPVLEAFEILIETHNDVKLILAGDGPQRSELEEWATTHGLGHTTRFAGKIPHSSLVSFLSRIDCFISLTRKPGLSISLVEAAAAGKPIIAFARKEADTYNEYFTHRKEIYLVNSLSPNEIVEALKILYADSDLRGKLAKGARHVAERYFNQTVARKQLEDLINKID